MNAPQDKPQVQTKPSMEPTKAPEAVVVETFHRPAANDYLAIFADDAAKDSLIAWQGAILDLASSILTDPEQKAIQEKTGVWEHGKSLPFPTRQNLTILPNGALVQPSESRPMATSLTQKLAAKLDAVQQDAG